MSFNELDSRAMTLAIEASEQALLMGDMPFGATLVSQTGEILMVDKNTQNSKKDCTAHAELALIRNAQTTLPQGVMKGASIYASGEPCAMCSGAIFWAGIARIVYAASQEDIALALGGNTLPLKSDQVLFGADPGVSVQGPLMREEAIKVLQKFNA
jgi:tRNA(Arg) A34 adenosine deaminase TadA